MKYLMNPLTISLDMIEIFGEPNKVTDTTSLRRFLILRRRIKWDADTGGSPKLLLLGIA
jgi:hypothetical protein